MKLSRWVRSRRVVPLLVLGLVAVAIFALPATGQIVPPNLIPQSRPSPSPSPSPPAPCGIRMAADLDNDPGDLGFPNNGLVEINTTSITVGCSGFVIVQGSSFVNNNSANADASDGLNYRLLPRLDGHDLPTEDFGGTTGAQWALAEDQSFLTLNAGEWGTLAYVTGGPVDAGTHTLTQQVGPSGGAPANFTVDWASLVVTFYPAEISNVTLD